VRTSSCAGSNGATARVLSEPHTSGFAARPKPPPESGVFRVLTPRREFKEINAGTLLGRYRDTMAWRAAVHL
jgi:hypothetical protein